MARQYGIKAVPHLVLYGPTGSTVRSGLDWMDKDLMWAANDYGVAKNLRRSDPAEALALLRKVTRQYPGTPAAAAARKLAEEMENDPALKADLQEKMEGRAVDLWNQAVGLYNAESYLEAYPLLKNIADNYEGTTPHPKAVELVGKLEADEEVMRGIRETELDAAIKRVLVMAKNYAMNGKPLKAIAILEEFAAKNEGTQAAAKARERIEKIRNGEFE
ncbi:MAG: hypothetical protein HY720_28725 [Planctomycetes bacterium]|nr:hypothetical protein [Planctomycetota bacterium]